jgi:hypothetical protein
MFSYMGCASCYAPSVCTFIRAAFTQLYLYNSCNTTVLVLNFAVCVYRG